MSWCAASCWPRRPGSLRARSGQPRPAYQPALTPDPDVLIYYVAEAARPLVVLPFVSREPPIWATASSSPTTPSCRAIPPPAPTITDQRLNYLNKLRSVPAALYYWQHTIQQLAAHDQLPLLLTVS